MLDHLATLLRGLTALIGVSVLFAITFVGAPYSIGFAVELLFPIRFANPAAVFENRIALGYVVLIAWGGLYACGSLFRPKRSDGPPSGDNPGP